MYVVFDRFWFCLFCKKLVTGVCVVKKTFNHVHSRSYGTLNGRIYVCS